MRAASCLAAALVALMFPLPATAGQDDRRLARPETATERRLALVIGNQAYPSMPLKNAAQDAQDVQAALAQAGFQIDLLLNATKRQMDTGVGRFVDKLQPGDVALVYFAGHGVQVSGENFLLPVDVETADEASVRYSSYSASLLIDRVADRGARLKILVLDACRNNPFRSSRSASQGLAAMTAPGRGTFIAFATGPGSTADDNVAGRNGLFTSALLEALREPALDLGQVFDRVRERVDARSGGRQTPWSNSSVVGRFFFRGAPAATSTPPVVASSNLPADLADLQQKCDRGAFAECVRLGYRFEHGEGIRADVTVASRFYQRGCDGGDSTGCTNLGLLYERGVGVVRDFARAVALHGRACEAGHARGCTNLGRSVASGRGVPKDLKRAADLYRRGCEGRDALGCSALGSLYDGGLGVAKDPAMAVHFYDQACVGGELAACSDLGVMIEHGTGAQKDEKRAAELYRRACNGGIALGCLNLGLSYEHGRGIAKEPARAAQLYQRACNVLSDRACYNLAQLYEQGVGVPQDRKRAQDLAAKACDGGYGFACRFVGVGYELGAGVPKDVARALSFYQKGCTLNDDYGCHHVGKFYERGEGVAPDVTRAIDFYGRACKMKNEFACNDLKRLQKK